MLSIFVSSSDNERIQAAVKKITKTFRRLLSLASSSKVNPAADNVHSLLDKAQSDFLSINDSFYPSKETVLLVLKLVKQGLFNTGFFEEYYRKCFTEPLRKFRESYPQDVDVYKKQLKVLEALDEILDDKERHEVLDTILDNLSAPNEAIKRLSYHFLCRIHWGSDHKNKIAGFLMPLLLDDSQAYFFYLLLFPQLALDQAKLETYLDRYGIKAEDEEIAFIKQRHNFVLWAHCFEYYVNRRKITNIFYFFDYRLSFTVWAERGDVELNLMVEKFFKGINSAMTNEQPLHDQQLDRMFSNNPGIVRNIYARLNEANQALVVGYYVMRCRDYQSQSTAVQLSQYGFLLGNLAYFKLLKGEALPSELSYEEICVAAWNELDDNTVLIRLQALSFFMDRLPDTLRSSYMKAFTLNMSVFLVRKPRNITINDLYELLMALRRNLSFADQKFLVQQILLQVRNLQSIDLNFYLHQQLTAILCAFLFQSQDLTFEDKDFLLAQIKKIIEATPIERTGFSWPIDNFLFITFIVKLLPEAQQEKLVEWLLTEKLACLVRPNCEQLLLGEKWDAAAEDRQMRGTRLQDIDPEEEPKYRQLFYYFLLMHLPIEDSQLPKLKLILISMVLHNAKIYRELDFYEVDDAGSRVAISFFISMLDHLKLISERNPELFSKDEKAKFMCAYQRILVGLLSEGKEYAEFLSKILAVEHYLGKDLVKSFLKELKFFEDYFNCHLLENLADLLQGGELYAFDNKHVWLIEQCVASIVSMIEEKSCSVDILSRLMALFVENDELNKTLREMTAPVAGIALTSSPELSL